MLCLGCGFDKGQGGFSEYLTSAVMDGWFETEGGERAYRHTARVCDTCRANYTGFIETSVYGENSEQFYTDGGRPE